MSTTHLLTEIQAPPPDLRREVEHFVEFLRINSEAKRLANVSLAMRKVWMAPDFDVPLDDFADYQ